MKTKVSSCATLLFVVLGSIQALFGQIPSPDNTYHLRPPSCLANYLGTEMCRLSDGAGSANERKRSNQDFERRRRR